ncbi:MAG: (d)CMP kinase [Acidobacteria bacterium]|nr:(d)CMP kinase [Acidobacteriota bacterium]
MSKRIVVAIDGPAGAGKSTIARRIAEKLGFLYIDTGAMYRAVALWALRNGLSMEDTAQLEQLAIAAEISLAGGVVTLNGEDVSTAIRTQEVSALASKVAAISGVRRALVEKQRGYSEATSVVMEGRDIGTVVFPNALVKVFLDASSTERARRRGAETGEETATVARQIEERDARDMTRAASPLMQAPDAIYVDSSGKTVDDVEEVILKLVRSRASNGKEVTR